MMLICTYVFLLIVSIFQTTTCKTCSSDEFQCNSSFISGGTPQCIPHSAVCNNVCDCPSCKDENAFRCITYGPPCIHKVPSRPYGFITSPGFPSPYPLGTQCRWLIQLGQYSEVVLRSIHFSLSLGDILVVYDGPDTSSTILGQYSMDNRYFPKLISSTGSVLIVLRSRWHQMSPWIAQLTRYQGFNVSYQLRGAACIPNIQRACDGRDRFDCYDAQRESCNGVWDCPLSGRDELGCPSCPHHEYLCSQEGGGCYTARERCDGKQQCRNANDELHCNPVNCGRHNGTFLCTTGQCIFESWRCDGSTDCSDGSDEINCPSRVTSKRVILAAVVGSLLCGLIIVLSMSYVCRVHALRALIRTRASLCQYESPLQGMLEAELRRRRPPPAYDEAMRTSRPFDDVLREAMAASRAAAAEVGERRREEPVDGDDDALLLDLGENSSNTSTTMTPLQQRSSNSQGARRNTTNQQSSHGTNSGGDVVNNDDDVAMLEGGGRREEGETGTQQDPYDVPILEDDSSPAPHTTSTYNTTATTSFDTIFDV